MDCEIVLEYYKADCSGFAIVQKDGHRVARYPAALGPDVKPGVYRADGAAAKHLRTFRSSDGEALFVVASPSTDVTLQPAGTSAFVSLGPHPLLEVRRITVRKCLFLFGTEPYRDTYSPLQLQID